MRHSHEARSHRTRSVAMVVLLSALLLIVLAASGPALAASAKVVRGATNFTVPRAQVAALTAKNVALLNAPPMAFRFQWASGVSWWFQAPLKSGGTFDFAAKKGTLYHSGGFRFVNVADNTSLPVGGTRFIAAGPSSFILSASVGTAPATRTPLFAAKNTPKITKRGKVIRIEGVQFKLTSQGALVLKLALGVDLSTETLFSDTDLQFTIK
jgi:hypothetical protein